MPRSSAAWIVAMLSLSSASPYVFDMPMQPNAIRFTFTFVVMGTLYAWPRMKPANRMYAIHERELWTRPRPQPPARVRRRRRRRQRDRRRRSAVPDPARGLGGAAAVASFGRRAALRTPG